MPSDGSYQLITTSAGDRPTFELTFFRIAEELSLRATCPRASVGCVITRNNQILSTGYNGAPAGMPHCSDLGCIMEGGHCVRSVHAEMNAIASAARHGVSLLGATAYCTLLPCINCFNALAQAGVEIILYDRQYEREERAILSNLAAISGIVLTGRRDRGPYQD